MMMMMQEECDSSEQCRMFRRNLGGQPARTIGQSVGALSEHTQRASTRGDENEHRVKRACFVHRNFWPKEARGCVVQRQITAAPVRVCFAHAGAGAVGNAYVVK